MQDLRSVGIIGSVLAIGMLGACGDDKGLAEPADAAGSEAPAAAVDPQGPTAGATVSEAPADPSESSEDKYHTPRNYAESAFFGDTHIHSSLSVDSSLWGMNKGPEEIYRFARGEEMTSFKGWKVKLIRPLDFTVVADHSDAYGFYDLIVEGPDFIVDEPQGARWHQMYQDGENAQLADEVIKAQTRASFLRPATL
jgi:hypothetical protein